MKIDPPLNIKIFFRKADNEQGNGISYNHYGVIDKVQEGKWLRLIKNNGQEALVNMDNVNQIITI